MAEQYFIRAKHYKKPVNGTIINHNGRLYGMQKCFSEWVITDILTGLRVDNYTVDTRTKQKAIDYIKNFDITKYENILKDAEAIFNKLPEYDFNKVYINTEEWRNNETCFYKGEYKGKQFETTLSIYKTAYEVDYFEGDFSEEEELNITEQLVNCKNNKADMIKTKKQNN